MGTVNYKTSNYITLGIKPYDPSLIEEDAELMEEIKKSVESYGGTVEEEMESLVSSWYEIDQENAKSILDKYSLYYFHIAIEYGYYEGLYIDIEPNFGLFYEDYADKQDAQKEITQIRKLLTELAGVGFVACFPSWVTGYKDYNGTLEEINDAIKEMRQTVKDTPTWYTYNRTS